jgi:hypothetical protein
MPRKTLKNIPGTPLHSQPGDIITFFGDAAIEEFGKHDLECVTMYKLHPIQSKEPGKWILWNCGRCGAQMIRELDKAGEPTRILEFTTIYQPL